MKELERMIDEMGKNISKDIYTAVRRATSHLSKNSEGGAGSPMATSEKGMTEDIKAAILSKADKTDIETLTQFKANKCDMELTFKWVELMHDQLKQTIVLIIEILKF